MGKTKPFIKKGEGHHFHIVHRSQADEAYGKEEEPSNFVLVSSDQISNDIYQTHANNSINNTNRSVDFDDNQSIGMRSIATANDHVNSLGFKNDGYDYNQHLKPMGSGQYFGKDGKPSTYETGNILELPSDALPSNAANDLERAYDAVTLDPTVMDEDLRAALFDGEDEEGDFEELLDDFVIEHMKAPDVPDFDFDAHIAALIERSESKLNAKPNTIARGWENENNNNSDNDDEEYDSDVFSDIDDDLSDDGVEVKKISSAAEKQFEKTLENYDDEDIGYLDEAEEEEVQGAIELDDADFEDMMDEFLDAEKESRIVNGFFEDGHVLNPGPTKSSEDIRAEAEEIDFKKGAKEQVIIQAVLEMENKDREQREASGIFKEIETCQEYLAEEKPVENWDCETILSSYSILENHPSQIQEPAKFRHYKNRYIRAVESSVENGPCTPSQMEDLRSNVSDDQIGHGPATRINLRGKMMLPDGYAPNQTNQKKHNTAIVTIPKLDSKTLNTITKTSKPLTFDDTINRLNKVSFADNQINNYNNKEDLTQIKEDDDDEDDENFSIMSTSTIGRPRNETPEERKIRKSLVKDERKNKREQKKLLKLAYKVEACKFMGTESRKQDIDSTPVFKYTL
jgi:protein LTV1